MKSPEELYDNCDSATVASVIIFLLLEGFTLIAFTNRPLLLIGITAILITCFCARFVWHLFKITE